MVVDLLTPSISINPMEIDHVRQKLLGAEKTMTTPLVNQVFRSVDRPL